MPTNLGFEGIGIMVVRRLLYPSPIMTAPSVMVVDVPTQYRGDSLPLGRYYPIIVETDAERLEVEHASATGWRRGSSIVLLDHRPSQLWSDQVLISRYDPPSPGWPWVAITRWPDSFRDVCADHGIKMARGCYTMELFAIAAECNAHC